VFQARWRVSRDCARLDINEPSWFRWQMLGTNAPRPFPLCYIRDVESPTLPKFSGMIWATVIELLEELNWKRTRTRYAKPAGVASPQNGAAQPSLGPQTKTAMGPLRARDAPCEPTWPHMLGPQGPKSLMQVEMSFLLVRRVACGSKGRNCRPTWPGGDQKILRPTGPHM